MQSECKCIYCVITPPLIAPEDSMLTRRTRYYDHGCILFIVTLLMLTISSCDFSQKEREIQEWSNLNKRVEELIPTYEKKQYLNYSVLDEYKKLAKQEYLLTYKVFGVNNLHFATSLFHLGVLSRNADSAKMHLEHSLEIRKGLLGTDNLLVADCYEELFRASPEYQNEATLSTILEIRKKILGEKNPIYINTFTNFALVRDDSWVRSPYYYSKAIRYVNEALRIVEKYKLDFRMRGRYLWILSSLYSDQKKWHECIRINKEIISEMENNVKDSTDEFSIASYKAYTAKILGRVGNYKEADSFYISSLSIYEKYNNKNFLDYGIALYGRAMLKRKMGNFEEASLLFSLFSSTRPKPRSPNSCDFWPYDGEDLFFR